MGSITKDDSDDAPPQKAPYFGMTGNQLNVWVTVACTTAMTLFGMCVGLIQEEGYLKGFSQVTTKEFLVVLSLLKISLTRWVIQTRIFKERLFLSMTLAGEFLMYLENFRHN